MRERMRERMMERMRERERKEERIMERLTIEGRWLRSEKIMIEKMPFVGLNPLGLTIFHLLNSSRVSMDPRSREFLIYAEYCVKQAIVLLKFLGEFSDRIESKKMKALEGEIRVAALEFENVLDSCVSDQFVLQTGTESIQLAGDERRPLLFSLNLQGTEEDIDCFIEKVIKMDKLLNPWFEEEEGDNKKSSVTRSWFMTWVATKAASVFLGMKEDYIQELENLLPQEKGDDDHYAVLFTRRWVSSRRLSDDRFRKIREELKVWWINNAASIFVMEREHNPLPEAVVSSRIESAQNLVGFTDLFCKIRDDLMEDLGISGTVTIVGMAGIGKTALVNKILQDPLISSKFDCRVFVRMGPECEMEEIKQAILAQMFDADNTLIEGDMDLECIANTTRKYLIVLDDVWNRNPYFTFELIPLCLLPSCVLVITTRINAIATSLEGETIYQVPFLNEEESWDLLRREIFGGEICPRELEKSGKKIAENCEGLPLLIVTVADLLSKAEMTPAYWSKVATNKTNSIFVDAYEQISEVVYPSYANLPVHLKACFLYLGAFPQNDEAPISKLISLWSVDGFLGVSYTLLQRYVDDFLTEIVSENVALGTQWTSYFQKLKACSLHSVFWYLCRREAWNEKFLLVLNSYKDAMAEGIRSPRRLSIYKNIIFSIKDVCDSIASMSNVHSLLCTGLYHQYQVPIVFGLRLLKVLDALTIRFYEFPVEVVKLVQLRYLALTCNRNLPPSISNLWGLHSLIVHQHLSIKSSVYPSFLPLEIWDLLELEHLQILGRNLPDPPPGAVLTNLLTLLDVGTHTCTKRVLGRIPRLKKLRVRIELMPVAAEPLSLVDDIYYRRSLSSLQCVVVNPELMSVAVAPVSSYSFLSIRKLTLSGCGYPWKDMNGISKMPHLQVLKLKCYAFQGEKWQVTHKEFRGLEYLSIEDTDLVQWACGNLSFRSLRVLVIKNCYKLREIPKISSLGVIRVSDCGHSAVSCAKQMETPECRVYIDSSWLSDGKLS